LRPMTVALQGNSAAAVTAGILLMSHARRLGDRLEVVVVGDPTDITPVLGPALVWSPVLASCGVGQRLENSAVAIIPGPPGAPLATCLHPEGDGPWFEVDRAGVGVLPATRAWVRLARSQRAADRALARSLSRLVEALGCPAEPAVMDLLLGAPAPPFTRLAVAVQVGRTLTGAGERPLTHHLRPPIGELPDPLPGPCSPDGLREALDAGRLQPLLDRVSEPLRGELEAGLRGLLARGDEHPGAGALACQLVDVAGPLASLPVGGLLPPLEPAAEAVAQAFGAGLGAHGAERDASQMLVRTFRFLGGRFAEDARYPVSIPGEPPPEHPLERWRWLCRSARRAADAADTLWRRVSDPPQ